MGQSDMRQSVKSNVTWQLISISASMYRVVVERLKKKLSCLTLYLLVESVQSKLRHLRKCLNCPLDGAVVFLRYFPSGTMRNLATFTLSFGNLG